ncbi:MAG: MFS transporter [Flavobacterium sp.]|uniref:MFS transporter n=1 Tax=Flavobacterium sp. 2 TaxID=308053 RepID=UPI000C182569|nr:MFS transporter [Flavobacterium sp. 2]PIF70810.1 putative MFS family arabinose efflux permease [Flavobacterium sp. 2]
MNEKQTLKTGFNGYQKLVIFLLALTQFTVVLDFMVMSPLGDIMMKTLKITASQFGIAVSAYAFSAGISGLLTAGFADKFDRKKLLLFFYIGFTIGTVFCAIAPSFILLVAARIFTGIFGGVIGSISMAIVADLFNLQQRGKVMGFIQMGFGVSQVLGIPIGLYIANAWGWHVPFLWIAAMAAIITLVLSFKLQPIVEHLSLKQEKTPIQHLWHTISKPHYQVGFLSTALLSIGGFMMMPFGSAFAINNLKVTNDELPLLFMITGVATLITMPIAGKLSDKFSKFKLFAFATLFAIIVMNVYAHFAATPFWIVLVTNILMMMAIMSRMVPSTTLTSAIPEPQDRGAFMSINSSLQQMAGGFGAMIAGLIIVQKDNYAPLEHYDTLAMVASVIMLVSIYLVSRVSKIVYKK